MHKLKRWMATEQLLMEVMKPLPNLINLLRADEEDEVETVDISELDQIFIGWIK